MDRCAVLEDGHGTANRVPPRAQVSQLPSLSPARTLVPVVVRTVSCFMVVGSLVCDSCVPLRFNRSIFYRGSAQCP